MSRFLPFETDDEILARLTQEEYGKQLSDVGGDYPYKDQLRKRAEDVVKNRLERESAMQAKQKAFEAVKSGKTATPQTSFEMPDIGGALVREALGIKPEAKPEPLFPSAAPASRVQATPRKPAAAPVAAAPESDKSQVVADYIKKKYGFGDEEAMRAARESASSSRLASGLGSAANKIGAAIAGVKADTSFYDKMRDDSDRPMQEVRDMRKGRVEDMQFADMQREADSVELESDPSSPLSQTYQTLAKRMLPGKDFSGMPASEIKRLLPSVEKLYEMDQRQADRAEARAERRMLMGFKMDEKRSDKLEKDTQSLADKLGNSQEIIGALDAVEQKLGFNLDEANHGKVRGQEIDLPGASVPGIGRVSFYDGDARELESAIAKVFNVELKDRSGAAVTTPEMARLRSEFASGKYNTEAEMIDALKQYKRAMATAVRNTEAAFRPEVVENYSKRGGVTSKSIKTVPIAPDDVDVDEIDRILMERGEL